MAEARRRRGEQRKGDVDGVDPAILDVSMPRLTGPQEAVELSSRRPQRRVLMLGRTGGDVAAPALREFVGDLRLLGTRPAVLAAREPIALTVQA